MNTNVVWTVCGFLGFGLVLTAFAGPTQAQDAGTDDCVVQLSDGQAVEVAGVRLTLSGDCDSEMANNSAPVSIATEPFIPTVQAQSATVQTLAPIPAISTTTLATVATMTPGANLEMVNSFTGALSSGEAILLPAVLFKSNSTQLPEAAVVAISSVAQAMSRVGGSYLIRGFASTDGTAASNKELSERRAWSTAQLLIRNGVPETSLSIQGMGETTQFGPSPEDNRVVTIQAEQTL